jgi:GrpB-like predicted nucleotidyltransferase (UPF0157 family)
MPMRVHVVPWSPDWRRLYADESASVARALGVAEKACHHVGSTAIPGIQAKPLIDLLVLAENLQAVDERNAQMIALGYEVRGESGIVARRFFRKDDSAGIRTHHVHVFPRGHAEAARMLLFRDFMIAHPEWAARYSELKLRLVRTCGTIEAYMDGKEEFIAEANRHAAAWRAADIR